MGGVPQPRKIAKIGLIVELEDGGKVMIYADNLDHAEVTITREPQEMAFPWGSGSVRRAIGVPQTSILIEGLESYRIAETMPAMADHMLEALNAGIQGGHEDLPPARRLEP